MWWSSSACASRAAKRTRVSDAILKHPTWDTVRTATPRVWSSPPQTPQHSSLLPRRSSDGSHPLDQLSLSSCISLSLLFSLCLLPSWMYQHPSLSLKKKCGRRGWVWRHVKITVMIFLSASRSVLTHFGLMTFSRNCLWNVSWNSFNFSLFSYPMVK